MPSLSMALRASSVHLPSNTKLQIRLFERQLTNVCHRIYPKCSRKVIMAQMSEPHKLKVQLDNPKCLRKVIMAQISEPYQLKVQLGVVRDRLREAVPESLNQFLRKKAENILLKRLIFLEKKALKCSLVALFIFSSLSDVVVSTSKNQELMIPFRLLIGYLMTGFLRETLREFFHGSQAMGLQTQLLSISCFFVLVKFIPVSFAIKARVFLLHVANGGLMQVLWLWKYLLEDNDKRSEMNCVSNQDAILTIDAED